MKHLQKLVLLSFFGFASSSMVHAENWKGNTEVQPIEVSLMTGAALFGSSTNWSVLGTGAYLLKEKGFADDMDDRVWLEGDLGPAFFSTATSTETALQYSAHLRWDFTLNEYWTFYGLGGLGGFVLPKSLNNTFTIHPRFGVGAEYQTKTALLFRGEFSSDFMGAGVAFNF